MNKYSHSEIIDFPINYDLFPKMKNIKFMEFTLNENEFLLIPNNWLHMVVTEPFTFALSFEIYKLYGDESSILVKNLMNQLPYKSYGKNTNFDYKSFISDHKDGKFRVLFSENSDLSPVVKNNTIKYFKIATLEEAYLEAKDKKYCAYVGQQDIDKNFNYNNIQFISKYINNIQETDIHYQTRVWLSLNKSLNSGLHMDSNSKILYVLKGKKTVYLLSPDNIENVYIKSFYTPDILPNNNEYNSISNNLERNMTKYYKKIKV